MRIPVAGCKETIDIVQNTKLIIGLLLITALIANGCTNELKVGEEKMTKEKMLKVGEAFITPVSEVTLISYKRIESYQYLSEASNEKVAYPSSGKAFVLVELNITNTGAGKPDLIDLDNLFVHSVEFKLIDSVSDEYKPKFFFDKSTEKALISSGLYLHQTVRLRIVFEVDERSTVAKLGYYYDYEKSLNEKLLLYEQGKPLEGKTTYWELV